MSADAYRILLQPRPRWQSVIWLTSLIVAGIAAWGVHAALQAAQDAHRSELILQQALAQRHSMIIPKPNRLEIEQKRQWAALAAERAYSWYPLFLALENSSNQDIELLELIPDKASGKIILRGEARSTDALSTYLSVLARQDIFDEVYLTHQKNLTLTGLEALSFEIKATDKQKGR